jgi:hypothetical protein
MKRNVLVFGLISGSIVTLMMLIGTSMMYKDPNFQGSMIIGYASMLLAFSFIFVGIKNYRDKYNGGLITFGKAFKIGFYISLIASTMYVLTWLVCYYGFMPDFMERYSDTVINTARSSGATEAEISKKLAEMDTYKEMYKNPLFVILLTYAEILPLGILVSLICSLILKRKTSTAEMAGS